MFKGQYIQGARVRCIDKINVSLSSNLLLLWTSAPLSGSRITQLAVTLTISKGERSRGVWRKLMLWKGREEKKNGKGGVINVHDAMDYLA